MKPWIILVGLWMISLQIAGQNWQPEDYNRYDHQTFMRSPMARQVIDLDRIDYGLLHAAVFFVSNQARIQHGKKPFQHSPALERAAYGHSRDMVEKNFFSHTSPIPGKVSMTDRMKREGIPLRAASENIALNWIELGDTYLSLAQKIVQQWMDSPSHKRNLLNAAYTYLGCGLAHDPKQSNPKYKYFKATQNLSASGAPNETPNRYQSNAPAQEQVRSSKFKATTYLLMQGQDHPNASEASAALRKIRSEGFPKAELICRQGICHIVLGVYPNKTTAQQALSQVRSPHPAAWIMRTGLE
ncbi:MAG: CAP domain-containing protein [Bernardetiaceae bacterium]